MINRVVLVGRLTKDPVLKKTPAGNSVVSFTLACNRNIKNQANEYEADFINCVAWNQRADVLSNYASKGSMIGVDGHIQTRSYDDQSGKRVYVTEVLVDSLQLIDTKKSNDSQPSNYEPSINYESYDEPSNTGGLYIDNDDLPF